MDCLTNDSWSISYISKKLLEHSYGKTSNEFKDGCRGAWNEQIIEPQHQQQCI